MSVIKLYTKNICKFLSKIIQYNGKIIWLRTSQKKITEESISMRSSQFYIMKLCDKFTEYHYTYYLNGQNFTKTHNLRTGGEIMFTASGSISWQKQFENLFGNF